MKYYTFVKILINEKQILYFLYFVLRLGWSTSKRIISQEKLALNFLNRKTKSSFLLTNLELVNTLNIRFLFP